MYPFDAIMPFFRCLAKPGLAGFPGFGLTGRIYSVMVIERMPRQFLRPEARLPGIQAFKKTYVIAFAPPHTRMSPKSWQVVMAYIGPQCIFTSH